MRRRWRRWRRAGCGDRGLPAIGLTEEYVGGDTSPYRHTAQDTASTVDRNYRALGTKLVAQVILSEL